MDARTRQLLQSLDTDLDLKIDRDLTKLTDVLDNLEAGLIDMFTWDQLKELRASAEMLVQAAIDEERFRSGEYS